MGVGFVADHEEVVLAGYFDNAQEELTVIDHSGGVIGVDEEDAGDGVVVLGLALQFLHVREPAVHWVQRVGQVVVARVGGLGGGQGRIGRRWADHARLAPQEAEDLGHRVAQAVEEDDVVGRDPAAPTLVHVLGQEFPGGRHAHGVGVGVAGVVHNQLRDDGLHPVRELLALLNGVADVLPGDLHARLLEALGHGHNLADLVSQLAGALVNDVASHALLPFSPGLARGLGLPGPGCPRLSPRYRP